MAEDHDRSQKTGKAAWLKIFTGFKLALDPKKLVLAAAGIFVMFLGWWVISWIFFNLNSTPPEASSFTSDEQGKAAYEAGVLRWTLLYELASNSSHDMIDNIAGALKKTGNEEEDKKEQAKRESTEQRVREVFRVLLATGNENLAKSLQGRHGLLRSCPWDEDRGPNQLTVAANGVRNYGYAPDTVRSLKKYSNFVIEPLYKFLLPVTYFFDSRAGGFWNHCYLTLIILWTVFTWGYFGGAITRIVAVQFARNEKVGLLESLKFVGARWQGYMFAPLLPMALLLVFCIIFWFFGLVIGYIPVLGDLLAGLLWPLSLIAGLIMAVVLVGLVGWPLMNATISTEGSDSFDALSRSYSYVFQAPWHCLGYALLSILYGAVLVFFVGFMGTLLVYLGKWGVSQAPGFESRDPAFLFLNAPTSFEWRDTFLRDSPHAVPKTKPVELKKEFVEKLDWNNNIATFGVGIWVGLFFLLIIGFGYSYFWTATGIIYMLVRQKVDDTDLDEVYLEEDTDQPFIPDGPSPAPPAAAPAPASTAPPGVTFTMVEPPAPPPAPAPSPPPPNNDATGKE